MAPGCFPAVFEGISSRIWTRISSRSERIYRPALFKVVVQQNSLDYFHLLFFLNLGKIQHLKMQVVQSIWPAQWVGKIVFIFHPWLLLSWESSLLSKQQLRGQFNTRCPFPQKKTPCFLLLTIRWKSASWSAKDKVGACEDSNNLSDHSPCIAYLSLPIMLQALGVIWKVLFPWYLNIFSDKSVIL